jgi:hypothetical protein
LVAAQHVGVKVDVTGPHDRAEVRVHYDGLKDRAVIANRGKHAAGLKNAGKVDLVDGAVGERQAYPAVRPTRTAITAQCARNA